MKETLDKLTTLSKNLWWSWNPDAVSLFRSLNPRLFDASNNNPIIALRNASPALLNGPEFQKRVDEVYNRFEQYISTSGRYADAPQVSYFCMEYGLHESLPFYSGGLGILAGDHIKAASDLGLPLTAVGILLRDGYFDQSFDHEGQQIAVYTSLDPDDTPLEPVVDSEGRPVQVTVLIGDTPLHLRAWRLQVGRVNLYLLDTDFDANSESMRQTTRKLYQGGNIQRIQQEIVLGIGGIRLLRALDIPADVFHLNEGHCAFLTLELLRERLEAGASLPEAEEWVRTHAVFTTHTPVKAGHDRFSPELFNGSLFRFRDQIGLGEQELLAYGRITPEDPYEFFTMTVLGLKLARVANGVSALNGEVARRQWEALYPDPHIAPIHHVTNGVHLPTWTSVPALNFLTRHLGNWPERRSDITGWQAIHDVPDEAIWEYRTLLRRRLIDYVYKKLATSSLRQDCTLDPEVLTIGFARRFATYKRAPLLFTHLEQAMDLFNTEGRPVQLIYAGKAHPHDETGQWFIRQIYSYTQHPAFSGKLIFLENYNMETARYLVSGCDVWLNNPRRPMEASGTSGQKVAVHGGLNLSILDGWWPEGYNGKNGWAIGYDASAEIKDAAVQDQEDAVFLYQAVRDEVIPTFYDRDERGIPTRWIQMIKSAMSELPASFSAERMVKDYIEQIYQMEMVSK